MAGVVAFAQSFAEDDELTPKRNGNHPSAVIINEAKQRATGLKTKTLSLVQHQPEYEAMGKVISIQPLLVLRERYLTAQAELESAKAKQHLAALNLRRQQDLFKNGVAPKRSLQDQETQGISEQAAVAASQAKVFAIANEVLVNWGKNLSEWVLSKHSRKLDEFIVGKQQLLQVTLPINKKLATDQASILIASSGNRAKAQPAALVSSATFVDNIRQGTSYFFEAAAPNLSIGMKITAWLTESGQQQIGFMIPESALIWYLDQLYVYCKTGNEGFDRRLIKHFSVTSEGYFVTEGLSADDEIVITGGQMLLSEELKSQIPDED